MLYCNLQMFPSLEVLSEVCSDKDDALLVFGKHLGVQLTFEGDGVPDYLFGSRLKALGWIKADCPVFRQS